MNKPLSERTQQRIAAARLRHMGYDPAFGEDHWVMYHRSADGIRVVDSSRLTAARRRREAKRTFVVLSLILIGLLFVCWRTLRHSPELPIFLHWLRHVVLA